MMPTQQARQAQPSAQPLLLLGAAFVSLFAMLVAAPAARAQGAGRNRSSPGTQRTKINADAMRDITREHLTEQINKQFERQRISLLPQIKEDFARIQVVNNEMMRAVFDANTVDYKNILDSTAEIRKRATRLKTNLMLPSPEGEDADNEEADDAATPPRLPPVSDHKALKQSLLLLDRSLMSFVTSPLFQQTGVLDAKLSTKASRDLRLVIKLSRAIRKSVERLTRTSAPDEKRVEQR